MSMVSQRYGIKDAKMGMYELVDDQNEWTTKVEEKDATW